VGQAEFSAKETTDTRNGCLSPDPGASRALDRGTVEAISDGNSPENADGCFSQLTQEQRGDVEAMDMNAAYVRSAKENFSLAENKIVHDRFHIMKLASEAADKVRRAEYRRLTRKGDNRLAGSRYLWLTGQERRTKGQRERFEKACSGHQETGKLGHSKSFCWTPGILPMRSQQRNSSATGIVA